MKKLIFVLVLFLFGTGLYAQNSAYGKTIHQDYGTFRIVSDEGNIVSLSAFVTIEEEEYVSHVEENMSKKEIKQLTYTEPEIEYRYELYIVSKSVFEGDTTNSWIYKLRIYVDDEDVLAEQFPDGHTLLINTEPILIYTHHDTNKFTNFELTWEKAIYEPRTHK